MLISLKVTDSNCNRTIIFTFCDFYMVKMENDVAVPSIICQRFVDDIYSRQKLGDNVLFD